MQYEDWRQAVAADVTPLMRRECERWLSALGWDISPGLTLAEQGRRAGRLPGFLARAADGSNAGWAFFSVERGVLSIGVITADRADVVRELLDLILEAPESAYARRYQGFLFPHNPAVAVALTRRRFTVDPQLLLSCDLTIDAGPVQATAGRAWREADAPGVVRLLARAYAGTPTALAFAPEGRLEEWVAYVGQIIRTPACGAFLPQSSIVVDGDVTDRPVAGLLATSTAPGVWHVAQVAVDPERRRLGLARALVGQTLHQAAQAGAREVTLVVDRRNTAARALYTELGFVEKAELLFAARPRLTRVTQAAATAATVS
jgi:ribosomal protein S18 acetylase RimI-like enzyme